MARVIFRTAPTQSGRNNVGASVIEYGLIAGLVAIVAVAAIVHLRTELSTTLSLAAIQGLASDNDNASSNSVKRAHRELEHIQ